MDGLTIPKPWKGGTRERQFLKSAIGSPPICEGVRPVCHRQPVEAPSFRVHYGKGKGWRTRRYFDDNRRALQSNKENVQ